MKGYVNILLPWQIPNSIFTLGSTTEIKGENVILYV